MPLNQGYLWSSLTHSVPCVLLLFQLRFFQVGNTTYTVQHTVYSREFRMITAAQQLVFRFRLQHVAEVPLKCGRRHCSLEDHSPTNSVKRLKGKNGEGINIELESRILIILESQTVPASRPCMQIAALAVYIQLVNKFNFFICYILPPKPVSNGTF